MNEGQKLSLNDFQYLAFQQTSAQVRYSEWNAVRDALKAAFNDTYGRSAECGLHSDDPVHAGTKISSQLDEFAKAAQAKLEQIDKVKNPAKLVEEIVAAMQPYLPSAHHCIKG
ncbi:MAG: hypothetical protein JWO78_1722 [Micavibrio sp.]|nr:hypothetical protein [Micavibrio sp.]